MTEQTPQHPLVKRANYLLGKAEEYAKAASAWPSGQKIPNPYAYAEEALRKDAAALLAEYDRLINERNNS